MEFVLIRRLARFIHGRLSAGSTAKPVPGLQDIQAMRAALMQCVADCGGLSADRLRHKIEQRKTVQDLWLLRNDAFQIISQQMSQGVASERINALNKVFERWVDRRQLTHIR